MPDEAPTSGRRATPLLRPNLIFLRQRTSLYSLIYPRDPLQIAGFFLVSNACSLSGQMLAAFRAKCLLGLLSLRLTLAVIHQLACVIPCLDGGTGYPVAAWCARRSPTTPRASVRGQQFHHFLTRSGDAIATTNLRHEYCRLIVEAARGISRDPGLA
jgi:hypothetical protein